MFVILNACIFLIRFSFYFTQHRKWDAINTNKKNLKTNNMCNKLQFIRLNFSLYTS
jgi:hypothetical protein